MKAPKIDLKEMKRHRRQILREREDMHVHWLTRITVAEWFAKAPVMSVAVAIRTAEILVLNREEMNMEQAMSAERKITEAKIKTVFETFDVNRARKLVTKIRRDRKILEREGIREV